MSLPAWAASLGARPGDAAAGWASPSSVSMAGNDASYPWASVTKILTAMAVWVALEEGVLSLAEPAGPPGSSVAHLLAHASGLAPDSDEVLSRPGQRRIYSNRGFDLAAAALERASGITWQEYVREAVIAPLGMAGTSLADSAAWGAAGPVSDMLRLGRELLSPTLVSAEMAGLATSVAFPGLAGVLPGYGRQERNDWGLGVEIRDHKSPHWTGTRNSAATFGHFGRSGSFLWVDPEAGVCAATAGSSPFAPWAVASWPSLCDDILDAAR